MANAPLYLAIALLAALVALVGTRVVRTVALSLNIADAPNDRRINTTLMPRAGGFAVALSFFLVGATVTFLAAPLGLTGGTPLPISGIAALLLGWRTWKALRARANARAKARNAPAARA